MFCCKVGPIYSDWRAVGVLPDHDCVKLTLHNAMCYSHLYYHSTLQIPSKVLTFVILIYFFFTYIYSYLDQDQLNLFVPHWCGILTRCSQSCLLQTLSTNYDFSQTTSVCVCVCLSVRAIACIPWGLLKTCSISLRMVITSNVMMTTLTTMTTTTM